MMRRFLGGAGKDHGPGRKFLAGAVIGVAGQLFRDRGYLVRADNFSQFADDFLFHSR